MTKVLKKFGVVLSLVLAFIFGLVINLPTNANAQNSQSGVSMRPGQNAQFTIEYSNKGEGGNSMQNAILQVYIGNELVIDPNSITDTFGSNGQTFRVSPSVVGTANNWGSVINYFPGSANNANSPSGSSQRGNLNFPVGEVGYLKFNATLKNDVLSRYQVGSVLAVDLVNAVYQGIYSILDHSGVGKQPGTTSITIAAPLSSSSAPSTCTNLAQPGSTTGGGFNGTSAQPTYTNITFNPNPGVIGNQLVVNTNGLIDNGCATNPLNGVPCSTTLQGPNGYNATANGTVVNGTCSVTFPSNVTPTATGTYNAVTTIQGPNGALQTRPASIQFVLGTVPTNLARTGGLSVALLVGSVAAITGAYAYYISRQRKLKISK